MSDPELIAKCRPFVEREMFLLLQGWTPESRENLIANYSTRLAAFVARERDVAEAKAKRWRGEIAVEEVAVARREATAAERERCGWRDSPTWPWVLAFAGEMERKLDQNRHKGNREGWARCEPKWLLARLREETLELSNIMDTRSSVSGECADIANFAMMIADVAGDLPAIRATPEAPAATPYAGGFDITPEGRRVAKDPEAFARSLVQSGVEHGLIAPAAGAPSGAGIPYTMGDPGYGEPSPAPGWLPRVSESNLRDLENFTPHEEHGDPGWITIRKRWLSDVIADLRDCREKLAERTRERDEAHAEMDRLAEQGMEILRDMGWNGGGNLGGVQHAIHANARALQTRVEALEKALRRLHDECSAVGVGAFREVGPMIAPSEQSVLNARALLSGGASADRKEP